MNWLAHLHLSGDSPATRIGNLLPDLLSGPEMRDVSERFAEGIRLHRMIDAYTDAHPVFRRSKTRIGGDLRRFSPILVDLFYDHFLASEWASYSAVPLEAFVTDFHASIEGFRTDLPVPAYKRLTQIRDVGYIFQYRDMAGLSAVLERLSKRFRRPVDLSPGVDALVDHYEDFAADFREFYPQLMGHVAGR